MCSARLLLLKVGCKRSMDAGAGGSPQRISAACLVSYVLKHSFFVSPQVMKLREHEMSWAETTASEMSLRAEMCALTDDYSSVSGDASTLGKRCEVLQRENAELSERWVVATPTAGTHLFAPCRSRSLRLSLFIILSLHFSPSLVLFFSPPPALSDDVHVRLFVCLSVCP